MCFSNIMPLGCFYHSSYHSNSKSVLETKRLRTTKTLTPGLLRLLVDGHPTTNVSLKKNSNQIPDSLTQ